MYYGKRILLEDVKPGMKVEFIKAHNDPRGIAGTVVGLGVDPNDGSKIVYLELPEPVPVLTFRNVRSIQYDLANLYLPDNEIRVIGYGTLEAMKDMGVEIPPGRFDPNDSEKRLYFLDQPIPASIIQDFCNEHFPGEANCVMQSMFIEVVPIHAEAFPGEQETDGIFRAI